MLVCQFFCISYITTKETVTKLAVLDIEITFALMVKHNATVRKGLEKVHFCPIRLISGNDCLYGNYLE